MGTQWVVVGAGKLGRGFLATVANELQMRSLLLVAGRNTTQREIQEFNRLSEQGLGYSVEMKATLKRLRVTNYQFYARDNTQDFGAVVSAISDARTSVLSTSVGLDHLREVATLVAAGLRGRASTCGTNPLLILVCENGRPAEHQDLTAVAWFRELLRTECRQLKVDQIAELPQLVVDTIVPCRSSPNEDMTISSGKLFVEDIPLARTVLGDAKEVEFLKRPEIDALGTRKLYCVNTLQCIISVLGFALSLDYVRDVVDEKDLQGEIAAIALSLADASRRRFPNVTKVIHGVTAEDYVLETLVRFGEIADPVDRALDHLRSGTYLTDSRIAGVLRDGGLVDSPSRAPELAHSIVLCLYFFDHYARERNSRRNWLLPNSLKHFKTAAGRGITARIRRGISLRSRSLALERVLGKEGSTRSPFANLLYDDYKWLDESGAPRLSRRQMSAFLLRKPRA